MAVDGATKGLEDFLMAFVAVNQPGTIEEGEKVRVKLFDFFREGCKAGSRFFGVGIAFAVIVTFVAATATLVGVLVFVIVSAASATIVVLMG
jgi:hypothetical protein